MLVIKYKYKYILFLVSTLLLCLASQYINGSLIEGFDRDNMYNHNICGKTPSFPGLTMFSNNISSPRCCGTSQYSSSGGCLCLCEEQVEYLLKRGGNMS